MAAILSPRTASGNYSDLTELHQFDDTLVYLVAHLILYMGLTNNQLDEFLNSRQTRSWIDIAQVVIRDVAEGCSIALLDIIDVVSSYVDLDQMRKAFRGLCPFHQDNSKSLFVHPLHQSYLCATCGAHGNVVKFVEEIEGFLLDDVMEQLSTRGDYVTSGMELTIEQWLHSAGYRQIEYVHVTAGLRKFVCQAVLPAAPVMALVEAFFGSYPLNGPLELWILPDNRRCLTLNDVLAERQDFNREQWDFITCANRLLKRKVQMDFRNAVRFARS